MPKMGLDSNQKQSRAFVHRLCGLRAPVRIGSFAKRSKRQLAEMRA